MPSNFFKSDESFIQKLAQGAAGTRFVLQHLAEQNIRAIPLERGSTGYKLWRGVKRKGLRLPDILCLDIGIKIESRAKTTLELSMSHSTATAARAWDSGLDDSDLIAIVNCTQVSPQLTEWVGQAPLLFASVRELRDAYLHKKVQTTSYKGKEEGFEGRIIWPTIFSTQNCIVNEIREDSIQLLSGDLNKKKTVRLSRTGIHLNPLVEVGQVLEAGNPVASVVPIEYDIGIREQVPDQFYLDLLGSPSIADRFAALKAIRYRPVAGQQDRLGTIAMNQREDFYVRLEAASCLLSTGLQGGVGVFEEFLASEFQDRRLEAVIVLAETPSDTSLQLLNQVLIDKEENEYIRGAAAWAIGETNHLHGVSMLVSVLNDLSQEVKQQAAHALSVASRTNPVVLIDALLNQDEVFHDGIAWALSKSEPPTFVELQRLFERPSTKPWLAYALGSATNRVETATLDAIGNLDQEVRFAIAMLWLTRDSWIRNIEEYA